MHLLRISAPGRPWEVACTRKFGPDATCTAHRPLDGTLPTRLTPWQRRLVLGPYNHSVGRFPRGAERDQKACRARRRREREQARI